MFHGLIDPISSVFDILTYIFCFLFSSLANDFGKYYVHGSPEAAAFIIIFSKQDYRIYVSPKPWLSTHVTFNKYHLFKVTQHHCVTTLFAAFFTTSLFHDPLAASLKTQINGLYFILLFVTHYFVCLVPLWSIPILRNTRMVIDNYFYKKSVSSFFITHSAKTFHLWYNSLL